MKLGILSIIPADVLYAESESEINFLIRFRHQVFRLVQDTSNFGWYRNTVTARSLKGFFLSGANITKAKSESGSVTDIMRF